MPTLERTVFLCTFLVQRSETAETRLRRFVGICIPPAQYPKHQRGLVRRHQIAHQTGFQGFRVPLQNALSEGALAGILPEYGLCGARARAHAPPFPLKNKHSFSCASESTGFRSRWTSGLTLWRVRLHFGHISVSPVCFLHICLLHIVQCSGTTRYNIREQVLPCSAAQVVTANIVLFTECNARLQVFPCSTA